jgi:hypothetical protein
MCDSPEDYFVAALKKYQRRYEAARSAGGITRQEVEDNLYTVPPGWVYDMSVDCFLPPNVVLL